MIDECINLFIDFEWVKILKFGWQDECKVNFQCVVIDIFQFGDLDLICDIWIEFNCNLVVEFD